MGITTKTLEKFSWMSKSPLSLSLQLDDLNLILVSGVLSVCPPPYRDDNADEKGDWTRWSLRLGPLH